jgi:hypothetical protein
MDTRQKPQSVKDDPEARPPSSPQTDPTNPFHAEAVGLWVASERNSERRERGPGLTDKERQGATGGRS